MPEYVIYGKIHIDHIVHVSSKAVFLGGGGPQGVFGARVWSDSVGFLTRSGTNVDERFVKQLEGLGVDLSGWVKFPNLPTPAVTLEYDENEYMVSAGIRDRDAWLKMMRTPIPVPETYRTAKAIHLITEWADEQMVQEALALRATGAVFSLEPLIDYTDWTNRDAILGLLAAVDVVTPDWPSASGIAGRDEPKYVLKHWTRCGAKLVAIRHGAEGAYVWSQAEDRLWHIPPVPIDRIVDPTGAGNAYGGGLVVGWTETGDARTAGCYGAISSYSMLSMAGIPPVEAALRRKARALLEPTFESALEM
jgi:sugar/nucleoside kinase (ribokinase family)